MNIISWLISRIVQFFLGSKYERIMSAMAEEREAGTYVDKIGDKSMSFEDDHRAATNMLERRMDKSFRDSYHARLSSGENSP